MSENEHEPSVDISILIPVYNEEECLRELRDELWPVLEATGKSCEIVFVDDGSTDGSAEVLRSFYDEDARVRVVRFVRNFGQQMATTAGLRHTRGRHVIIMDADLQSPAEHIPEFLEKLDEGYDIVYGVRERLTGPLYRRVGTIVANYLIHKMTRVNYPDAASGFIALNNDLVRNVNRYNEKSRYLSSLFAWLSYGRFASIRVKRRPRKYGKSNYTFWPLVRMVINIVTNWSSSPLYISLWAGLATIAMGSLVALRWLYVVITSGWGQSETTLYTAALITVGGIQLCCLGILGVYISRIHGEVRENPPYVIADILERD